MSKGRMARNKGKRGERMLATELREAFPEFADEIRRGWQTREGDDDPDVIVPFDVWFESKFLAKFNSAPLQQAINDAKGRGIPIAVIRTNRKEPIMMMRWLDGLLMLQVWVRAMKKGADDGNRGSDKRGDHCDARGRGRALQRGDGDVLRPKRRREDVQGDPKAGKRWRVRLR